MLESSENNECDRFWQQEHPPDLCSVCLNLVTQKYCYKRKKKIPCWYTRTNRLQCWKNQWKEKPLSCLCVFLQIWSKYKMHCKLQDWRVAQHGSPTQSCQVTALGPSACVHHSCSTTVHGSSQHRSPLKQDSFRRIPQEVSTAEDLTNTTLRLASCHLPPRFARPKH